MNVGQKSAGLVRLLRFELPLAAGICVVMGQMFALGHFASVSATIAGALSIFCISAAILVLNDVIDLETDRINAPDRPIPSGIVTRKEALVFSMGILATGLISSYAINMMALICAVIVSVIGILYDIRFKRYGLWGNLMVSISVGMTFVYGGITVGSYLHPLVWLFGGIAALTDLGEEIAADVMDAAGDGLIGSRSLAIRYGRQTALTVSACLFVTVILLTTLPFVFRWLSMIYLAPILFMDGVIAICTILLWRPKGNEGRAYIRWLYLGATAGLVMILVMRLFGV